MKKILNIAIALLFCLSCSITKAQSQADNQMKMAREALAKKEHTTPLEICEKYRKNNSR